MLDYKTLAKGRRDDTQRPNVDTIWVVKEVARSHFILHGDEFIRWRHMRGMRRWCRSRQGFETSGLDNRII